jgi:hypothetical protein
MTRKFSWISAVSLLLLLTSGCGKKTVVVNAPTGVNAVTVANWYKATGAFSQIADLTQQGEQTLRQANTSGILPDGEYYQKLLRGFGQIAITQRSAAEYLKSVPNTFGAPVQARVGGYTKAIQGFVNDLVSLGVVGIKDPNTQQLVSAFISEIGAAVNFVLTFTTAENELRAVPLLEYQNFAEMREVYVG